MRYSKLFVYLVILSLILVALYAHAWEGQIEVDFELPQDVILDTLAECESGRDPLAINPHDPVTPSYGAFQFKLGTAKYYLERYQRPIPPDEELIDLLFTYKYAEELASQILNEGHWPNWYNCLRSYYEI